MPMNTLHVEGSFRPTPVFRFRHAVAMACAAVALVVAWAVGPARAGDAGTAALQARLMWSVVQGVEDEGSGDFPLIGRIVGAAATADGTTYLLDAQLKQVLVVDGSGRFVRTVGRQGEGPGEFRQPICLSVDSGGRVHVGDMMPAQVVVFGPTGEYAKSLGLTLDGKDAMMSSLSRVAVMDAGYCIQGTQVITSGDKPEVVGFLSLADPELHETARIVEARAAIDPASGGIDVNKMRKFSSVVWTAGKNLYLAHDPTKYEIEVRDTAGKVVRVITRDVAARPYTDEERKEMTARIDSVMAKMPAQFKMKMETPEKAPIIVRMMCRGDALFVQTDPGRDDDGKRMTFDVFDGSGAFEGHVVVAMAGNEQGDGVLFTGYGPLVVRGQGQMTFGTPGGQVEASDEIHLMRYAWPDLEAALAGSKQQGR